jgi:cyclic lactone autoinducer peptide
MKKLAVFASRALSLVALTAVTVASPWWYHRAEAPQELLNK